MTSSVKPGRTGERPVIELPEFAELGELTAPPELPGLTVERSEDPQSGAVILEFRAELTEPLPVEHLFFTFQLKQKATFFWSPHLTPEDGDLVDEHVFRTPAVLACGSDWGIALLPETESVEVRGARLVMDLDAPRGELSCGVARSQPYGHTLFCHGEPFTLPEGRFVYRLGILPLRPANPFEAILKYYEPQLRRDLESTPGLPNLGDLDAYEAHAYAWAYKKWPVVYQEPVIDERKLGAPQFIVTAYQSPNNLAPHSVRESCSIWFQAWFNALRTALGTACYARRVNDPELFEQALRTKELALTMPQDERGFFPSVLAVPAVDELIDGKEYRLAGEWEDAYLGNSNRNPVTWDLAFAPLHLLDMSRTGSYFLDWYENIEKDPRILSYLAALVRGFLDVQDENGYFPAWIDENEEPLEELRQSPESASIASFLLRYLPYAETQTEAEGEDFAARCREAALRAIGRLNLEVLPQGRWEDFETYWSCSRFGIGHLGKRFERNAMFKQNTLSIFFLAEANLLAYETTGDENYLHSGKRCLDELLMFQSSYQPKSMPVPVVGGFGVMNGDGELNDARQSLFAPLILRYARVLQDPAYRMRGFAALRASFTLMYCPENPELKALWEERWPFFNEVDYGFMMENFAHGGSLASLDAMLGEFSIFDWGAGGAAEACERTRAEGLL